MRHRLLLSLVTAALAVPTTGHTAAPAAPAPPPVVTITLPHSTGATASVFTGTVTVLNPPRAAYRLLLEYWEGRTASYASFDDEEDCTTRAGEVEKFPFRHAYRLPGTWTIRATLTLGCGLGSANPQFTGAAVFAATPAGSPSNGPFRPSGYLFPEPPADPFVNPPGTTEPPPPPGRTHALRGHGGDDEQGTVDDITIVQPTRGKFIVGAEDYDGYVSTIVIRWCPASRTLLTSGVS